MPRTFKLGDKVIVVTRPRRYSPVPVLKEETVLQKNASDPKRVKVGPRRFVPTEDVFYSHERERIKAHVVQLAREELTERERDLASHVAREEALLSALRYLLEDPERLMAPNAESQYEELYRSRLREADEASPQVSGPVAPVVVPEVPAGLTVVK